MLEVRLLNQQPLVLLVLDTNPGPRKNLVETIPVGEITNPFKRTLNNTPEKNGELKTQKKTNWKEKDKYRKEKKERDSSDFWEGRI